MKKMLIWFGAWALFEGAVLVFFPKQYLGFWKYKNAPTAWNECLDRILDKPPRLLRVIGCSEALCGLLMLCLSRRRPGKR